MRSSPGPMALAVALLSLAVSPGCGDSSDADPSPAPSFAGLWSGAWTGAGADGVGGASYVATLELVHQGGRVVGTLAVMPEPPHDVGILTLVGTLTGDVVDGELRFDLEAEPPGGGCQGTFVGTARTAPRAGGAVLALRYAGVSACGGSLQAADTLVRLDGCPAGLCVLEPVPYCADFASDEANCAYCGRACPGARSCEQGWCVDAPCTGPVPLGPVVRVGIPPLIHFASDVSVVDVTGDGRPDVVTAQEYEDSVAVLLNDGAGGLTPLGVTPAASMPTQLAVGDFDDDGRVDVAALGTSGQFRPVDGMVSVHLGDGAGSFTRAADLPLGPSTSLTDLVPDGLVAADLDGDGVDDLAAVSVSNAVVSVFLSRPGGFAPALTLPAPGAANGLAAGDLDGDGALDLAVGVSYSTGPTVGEIHQGVLAFLGRGDGTFADGVEALGPCTWQHCTGELLADDLDADGRTELLQLGAVPQRYDVATGGALDASQAPVSGYRGVLADFDRDGRIDLLSVWGNELLFFAGASDGSFGPATATAFGRNYSRASAGDLDGDGRLDLALIDSGNDPAVVYVHVACAP